MKHPKSFKWKYLDKFFKPFYRKIIVKAEPRGVAHKAICWLSRNFDFNEFFYQFGCPGLWWHGYLPIKEFGEPISWCDKHIYPGFGYYEFEIRTIEDLQKIMAVTDETDKKLNRLNNDNALKHKNISFKE